MRKLLLFLGLCGSLAAQTIPVSPGIFSLSGTGGGGGGSGTVTSVSFTGGLISVATATTTPAFTVAGTSGGIPYFSSTSTWASSTLLTNTAIMVGGGAGAAPTTPSATTVLDTSGNLSTPGSLTSGAGGTVAGYLALGQGTAPSTGTTNITFYAPASVTSYKRVFASTAGSTGLVLETVSGTTQTESLVTALPSGFTATTASVLDNSTKVATTAYADRAAIVGNASVNLGNCTGTINIDWSLGQTFRGVLTGSTTFTFSNASEGQTITVDVAQTGTNTFTVTWPTMKWPTGVAPTMTTGAATSDITTIIDFNSVYKGSSVQNVK